MLVLGANEVFGRSGHYRCWADALALASPPLTVGLSSWLMWHGDSLTDWRERDSRRETEENKKRQTQTVKYYTIPSARGINTGSHFAILNVLYYENNHVVLNV